MEFAFQLVERTKMRQGNKPQFLMNGSEMIGVNLGADFCSEHEWGIKDIRRAFGLKEDESIMGIERRRVTTFPDATKFALLKTKEHWTLIFRSYGHNEIKEFNDSQLHRWRDAPMTAAWSEGDFAVRVFGGVDDRSKLWLEELYHALIEGGAAIWLGGGWAFQNAGLTIAIIDRIPQESLDQMRDSDLEVKQRMDATEAIEKKTNLTKRLKDAEKRWIALSPKIYVPENKGWREHTIFDIVYWLNPSDQQNNKYGYVTVEDLLAWAQDKGPIVENLEGRNGGFAGSVDEHVQKGVFGK